MFSTEVETLLEWNENLSKVKGYGSTIYIQR